MLFFRLKMKVFFLLMCLLSGLLVAAQTDRAELHTYYGQQVKYAGLYSQKRQLYLDSVLILKPDSAAAWQQKAMPLFKQRKYELGMTFLDKAVLFDKENYWLQYRAFIKCIFQKNYQAAIDDFNKVQTKIGYGIIMDHSFDFYIGLSYLQLNEFDKANFYIQKSVEYAINNRDEAHFLEDFYLGIVKMELDDMPNALSYFDKSLKVYTNFADALYYKALILSRSDSTKQEATALFAKALNCMRTGYSVNEDNAIYEDYPYKIRLEMLERILN
jgi:hypothetical protein